ncbi:uncharacterized protein LOC144007727 [Festucalex cinctus]
MTLWAARGHTCDRHYQPLPAKHLDQVFGEWRLVWGAADVLKISDVLASVVSLHPKGDVRSRACARVRVTFVRSSDHSCVTYSNATAPVNKSGEDPLVSHAVIDSETRSRACARTRPSISFAYVCARVSEVVSDGSLLDVNISFTLHFYERSPDAMLMFVEAEQMGRFLLSYARASADPDRLKAEHDKLEKMAACLSFTPTPRFVDDGAAGQRSPRINGCARVTSSGGLHARTHQSLAYTLRLKMSSSNPIGLHFVDLFPKMEASSGFVWKSF